MFQINGMSQMSQHPNDDIDVTQSTSTKDSTVMDLTMDKVLGTTKVVDFETENERQVPRDGIDHHTIKDVISAIDKDMEQAELRAYYW